MKRDLDLHGRLLFTNMTLMVVVVSLQGLDKDAISVIRDLLASDKMSLASLPDDELKAGFAKQREFFISLLDLLIKHQPQHTPPIQKTTPTLSPEIPARVVKLLIDILSQ